MTGTHASAHHLLYNSGKNAFVDENKSNLSLDVRSAARCQLSFMDLELEVQSDYHQSPGR